MQKQNQKQQLEFLFLKGQKKIVNFRVWKWK